MGKETIHTDDAPPAAGAYSQATTEGDIVFTAGQVALTPDGEALDSEPIEVQTERALENVEAMNEVYAGYFGSDPPARSAIEVGSLPLGMAVEIEAVATRS